MRLVRYGLPILLALVICLEVDARVGGGSSYSGSSSSSSSKSSGDNGFIIYLFLRLIELHFYAPKLALTIDAILIVIAVFYWRKRESQKGDYSSRVAAYEEADAQREVREDLSPTFRLWTKFDPNFSEILFEDFLHGLYANLHTARGQGKLDDFAPFANARSRKVLDSIGPADLTAVEGIIIGSFEIIDARIAKEKMAVTVRFEANYTERTESGSEETYYVVEKWELRRKLNVLSKPPGGVSSNNCPKCGAGLQFTADRKCRYCLAQVSGGEYDWGVISIDTIQREARGPLLTQEVPDVGLDRPTVKHPNLDFELNRLSLDREKFSRERFLERVEYIFHELQQSWSDGEWTRSRPFVTDRIFDSYHYWIEAYQRQKLRNVLDQIEIGGIVFAKVAHDSFHDSITVRIYASMIDYVADQNGKVVRGNSKRSSNFSEYWTFIRRKGVGETTQKPGNCPNCGAGLQISMAGVCEYCNSKITNGEFDWVLSRIEQDEAYRG